MKILVKALSPKEWAPLSENAHRAVFSEIKPPNWDRIDYALLGVDAESNTVLAYLTAREMDPKTVYWQFGGAFPSCRGTIQSFRTYEAFVAWARERYENVFTLIRNDNLAMLKAAMKVGFRIVGVRNFKGEIYTEQLLVFQGG